ncbi:MAG: tripartite tricarboxylate transporter substrate binding protein [Kiloniellaceae bacterium]|nr:tripartite tricarboxylate transporter substrate binding protein [Kiloniellaceae bacterium]
MKRLLPITLAGVLACLAATGAAAQDYPSRDVRMVVPWGAGGGTDGIVRKVSTIAEKELGGTIYVENIEGGISATGVMQAMSARPDGYTIASLTYDSVVTVPWQKLLPGYNLEKLALIARITSEADAIIASADASYGTFEELIAAAKEQPGEIQVAIQNLGSRTHLTMLRLEGMTGAKFDLIAYPGGAAPQKEALLSGEVDYAVTSLGDFASLLDAGDAKGIVEFSDAPNPAYKDVPIAKDAGVDLEMGSFIVLAAPAGTPDDVIAELEDAYKAAYDSGEFQNWVAKVGVTPSWLGSGEVTDWANQTQGDLFTLMQDLEKQGVLKQ